MPRIPPKTGVATFIEAGQVLEITDTEGAQACDLVAFSADDHAEFFSAAKTRLNCWRVRITTGDYLYSNRNRRMFTIIYDTVGVHDLLLASCNRYLYEHHFGVGPRDGCLELLQAALEPHGISPDLVPDPFNLFTNTVVLDEADLVIRRPVSRAGDHVRLRAEFRCLVGLTSCPEDISDCNAGRCTPIDFLVRDSERGE